jgi:general secretion pathway protein K
MFKSCQKQVGSALITALFIMTLITIAATAMTMRLQLDIYRTRLTLSADTLDYASQFVTFWAISELANKNDTYSVADLDGKVAQLPNQFKKFHAPVVLTGALYDLQSRFNINDLSNPSYFITLLRLLDSPSLRLETDEKRLLVMGINQWLSSYKPGGEKDNSLAYYLSQKPPYLPAHQLLHSLSELRLMQGITAPLYNALAFQLSALPEVTPLNINTMPPSLLHILGYGLNEEQIELILKKRAKKGIQNPAKLAALLKRINVRPEQVTLSSQYFLCIATASSEELTYVKYTVIKRSQNKQNTPVVTLISESVNTL